MKAFKIWIATHPEQPANREVSLSEPNSDHTTVYSMTHDDADAYVPWVEHVCLELEV